MIKDVTMWIYLLPHLLILIPGVSLQNGDKLYLTDTTRRSVLSMPLSGGIHTRLPIPNLINPIAVAYDPTTDTIFATERGGASVRSHKFIIRYRFTTGDSQRYNLRRSSIPDGLVVDPISQLLFYTDARDDIIGVLTTDLRYHNILVSRGLDQPRALAVDPIEGFIYWSDWSESTPHIGRVRMDGANQRIIVSFGLGWPNGMFLDTTGPVKYIYWCDAKLFKVERSKTDGSDRRVLLQSTAHFYGIVLDETYIYLTDWRVNAIQRMQKDGSSLQNLGTVYPANGTRMNGLAIKKSSLNPTGTNACSQNSGGCAHICLPTGPNGRVCECSQKYFLKEDGTSCEELPLRRGLIVSDVSKQDLFLMDLDKDLAFRADIFGHAAVRGLAYDMEIDKVFWTDGEHKFVASSCAKKSCVPDIIHNIALDDSNPDGIALDRTEKKVYFVDLGLRTITSMGYRGSQIKLLINSGLESPRGIALNPGSRQMYWTNLGSRPRIEMANMDDGNARVDFVSTNLNMPIYLAIDLAGQRLFWTDAGYGRVEMIKLDGTGRQKLYEKTNKQYLGITYGANTLYWSELNVRGYHSLDIVTGNVAKHENKYLDNIYGLDYFGEEDTRQTPQEPSTGNMEKGSTVGPVITPTSEETKGSGGLDTTLIIALAVSISGVVIIVLIIIVGVICYKKLDAHISRVSADPTPYVLPVNNQQPKIVEEEIYDQVLDFSPPTDRVRPPAPLPGAPASRRLPEVPPAERSHPYLGAAGGQQPDLIPMTLRAGPPPLPKPKQPGASTKVYVDRPTGTPDYAGLLQETRDTSPPNVQYARFTNAES